MPENRKWLFDGAITIDGMLGETPDYTRGKEVSVTWLFRPSSASRGHISRYNDVKEWMDVAGKVAINNTNTHEPRFEEQTTGEERRGSPLVKVEPQYGNQDHTRGFWGLIMGMEDQTKNPRQRCLLQMNLLMLTRIIDNPQRAQVLSEFSPSLV